MKEIGEFLMAFIETGGLFAPLLFISFHLLRSLFFFPVVVICISGGLLFGAVAGTVYSVIGITLSSIIFYIMIHWMPKTHKKLIQLKQKLVGKHAVISTPQITLLRLIPFIHFHLLSICLMETSGGLKDYTKASLFSSIPFALIYTSIGNWLTNLSPLYIGGFLIVLALFIYALRSKETYIKWYDFFQLST